MVKLSDQNKGTIKRAREKLKPRSDKGKQQLKEKSVGTVDRFMHRKRKR